MVMVRRGSDETCQVSEVECQTHKFILENVAMKTKQLLELLSQMPADVDVVVKGYEGGVDDVINVKLVKIKKDVHDEWYYGKHEIDNDGDVQAVFIQRDERASD